MSDEVLNTLMSGLGIAAFERRVDGSFAAVSPVPTSFQWLAGDGTFRFLGHILDAARDFWNSGEPKLREWGPCCEVDEAGHQFHYKVTAVTMSGRQYLVFQLDQDSDQMQAVVQKLRERELVDEQEAAAAAVAAPSLKVVREAVEDFRALLRRWPSSASIPPPLDLLTALSLKSDELIRRLDAFLPRAAAG